MKGKRFVCGRGGRRRANGPTSATLGEEEADLEGTHAHRDRLAGALAGREAAPFHRGDRGSVSYDLRRVREGGGEYTVAVINEKQAEIVRRIFREFLEGRGLKKIAIGLNNEGIPSPMAGTRGTGSWSPGCVTPDPKS